MKTLVIGGGMAGLTYAIVALKNGMDVTIAERNNRVGKKIAMT
ncbi:MAG: NAD(P)/FAD-dependent oxidoreductase, partial [Clostridia bacterium]|nr:NAD(P)/FAD-dependent oxidoreductase [Clostridia bacterium]